MKFEDFIELEEGWDGQNAKKPHERNVRLAREMTDYLSPLGLGRWEFVPIEDGSVMIEIHDSGFDVEIWINNVERSETS